MILNNKYYESLWDKFKYVQTLSIEHLENSVHLSTKMILEHDRKNKSLHINFQNSKESILKIARQLFVEFANDIYLNHYDLPDSFAVGDKFKRIRDNQYYEITRAEKRHYTLKQVLSNTRGKISPAIFPDIDYDKITKGFVKVDSGVSEKTIKNYFDFFAKLNNQNSDFPRSNFDMKYVFIAKKPLWDSLSIKSKIPSAYFPNPREESNLTEIRSIPALSDCMIYFTPKYEVCYQQILQKGVKIKTIVIFDTEVEKINQILQDQLRYKFNVLVLSNSSTPTKSQLIPCWNWFKEELIILDAL
jgi:hypothetical protein